MEHFVVRTKAEFIVFRDHRKTLPTVAARHDTLGAALADADRRSQRANAA